MSSKISSVMVFVLQMAFHCAPIYVHVNTPNKISIQNLSINPWGPFGSNWGPFGPNEGLFGPNGGSFGPNGFSDFNYIKVTYVNVSKFASTSIYSHLITS